MNGAVVFRRAVNHPGPAERPFMTIARDLAQQAGEHAAVLYCNAAIAGHNG